MVTLGVGLTVIWGAVYGEFGRGLMVTLGTARGDNWRGLVVTLGDDPHNFNADPDPAFHVNADPDPDPAFHFNADPDLDPVPHLSDGNLRPLVYRPSRASIVSDLGLLRPSFEPQMLLNFYSNADPDPAFFPKRMRNWIQLSLQCECRNGSSFPSNVDADPDPGSKINADPDPDPQPLLLVMWRHWGGIAGVT
jgi:hypothetical protein